MTLTKRYWGEVKPDAPSPSSSDRCKDFSSLSPHCPAVYFQRFMIFIMQHLSISTALPCIVIVEQTKHMAAGCCFIYLQCSLLSSLCRCAASGERCSFVILAHCATPSDMCWIKPFILLNAEIPRCVRYHQRFICYKKKKELHFNHIRLQTKQQ